MCVVLSCICLYTKCICIFTEKILKTDSNIPRINNLYVNSLKFKYGIYFTLKLFALVHLKNRKYEN